MKREQKIMERRTVLKGGVAAVGILGGGATSAMVASAEQASADTAQSSLPDQILTAVQRFRETIPANFDREYVEKVVIPFFLTSFYEGERPMLPVIDVNFSKENALPYDLWGLITRDWRPTPEDGVTVFLQGLEKRGPNNLRKRIYFSAVTPDLYKPMYNAKVVAFFDKLTDQQFANKPFMRHYLDYYFDLYWDLHLGVTGDAIPFQVRQIGEAFNTVLAYRNPLLPITYDNYMIVRERLAFLKSWIDDRLADIESGKTKNPEKTMAWYWLKNAGDGSHFAKKDVVFECFHNFVALSQWGNSIFGFALIRRRRRPGCAGIVSEDDERKFRQRQRRPFLATGIVRHGIIPRYIAKWRKHLGNPGCEDKRLWRISTAKVWLSHGTP
jgi:hypothetical protein